jgi:fructose-bisphosphate aldolase class II
MLVTLKEILHQAEGRGVAIGAFNTPNLESLRAVLEVAARLQTPVILSHAEVHEALCPLEIIGPVMVEMARKARVEVAVHLDHGVRLPYLQRALELGFTSVMYDGSLLPYEENVENTRAAVRMAKAVGASVEGEVGVMAGAEDGTAQAEAYTDPQTARRFTEETGIDALAASFGTVHGLYKTKPALDFPRIAAIRKATGTPLVMHGGSGLRPEDYKAAIAQGVSKINYYSYMAKAGAAAVEARLAQGGPAFYHDLALAALEAMAQDVEQALRIFSGLA